MQLHSTVFQGRVQGLFVGATQMFVGNADLHKWLFFFEIS